ncbi:prepilin peptidase [Marinicauda pacifica]|jgi:leader peptidase (prepilin peptidase)/N-methyltransferase|uniref:Prepilin peptidase n=1 Tax=Marinicauda pacifica TaxID=1133559 RepID=A0A4S2H8P7_9PROT|nr:MULTISPECIES: A24 family peptidase [Marinicauda]TGY92214.1 prepilin peptidase [Marinicauda pacifica]GGE46981.1 prepilin peptidase [Marinicauda pacifica]
MIAPALIVSSLVLLPALAVLAWIDARTYRLPDILTLPLIAAGLAAALWLDRNIWLHLSGAALGYLVFVGIELAYRQLRDRDGLGRGDAKLLAAGGAWCSVAALPLIVLLASVTALCCVFALRLAGQEVSARTLMAFGPFLAFAIALVWIVQIASPGFPLYL